VSLRARFVAMYVLLAGIAAALIAAAVAFALAPATSSVREGHRKLKHPAAEAASFSARGAEVPKLSGFAASFQDYANAAQSGFGGAKLVVRDCIEGGDGTAFCAYTVQGVCHGAMLIEQSMTVKQAGNVGLPAAECTARHALKWIGANG
jgi:hypothetical protein